MLDLTSTRPARIVAEVGAIPLVCASEDGEFRVRRLLWPLILVLISHAAGIVWADRGGLLPASLGLVSASSATALGLLLCGLLSVRAFDSPPAAGRLSGVPPDVWRVAALIALAILAFTLGHAALRRELDRARSGRELAEALAATAIRLVDARVHARRATGFGEEVELWDVRGRPGEGAVPERLILGLVAGRRIPDAVSRSRAEQLLWPGAEVRLGVRIRPLHPPRNPGTADREHALARRGIAARARLVKPDWVVERIAFDDRGAQISGAFAALRRDVLERVRERLEGRGEGEGLVRALALGDRRGLSDTTRRSFRQLGLVHLLSVSGLHIGFVAFPAAWSIAWLRTRFRPRSWAVLGFLSPVAAGCAAAGLYAWLTGAEVAALRASLLFALFGLTRSLGWTIPPAPSLAAIALLLLVVDPANLFDVGARFSFGACAALVAGGIWVGRRRQETVAPTIPVAPATATGPARRALQALGDPLRASLAVSIGMLPLIELYALPRSLPSPLVNALAIPWAGFVVMPSALIAAVLASALPRDTGAGLLAALLLPAAWLERAAGALAAQLPATWIGEDLPGRIAWPGAIALVALALCRLRRGDVVSPAVLWLALALLGIAPIREASFDGALPRVVFFDVGQADAALVQTRDAAWLIDSGSGPGDGSGGAAVLRAIRAQGVTHLDVLVITHGDLDHRGGALRVLSVMKVGELWLPSLAAPDPALDALSGVAAENGVRVRRVGAGDRREVGESMKVEVLWPPAATGPSRPDRDRPGEPTGATLAFAPLVPGRSRNDASLVLSIELEGLRVLFAADVGANVEAALQAGPVSLRSDLLKVAHHGSRHSASAGFLRAVAPRIAIVSAPCEAARGLPSLIALERLRASGAELGWTGRDGALAVEGDGAARAAMRYWGTPRRCAAGFSRAETKGRGGLDPWGGRQR